jgi:hypothetical protein
MNKTMKTKITNIKRLNNSRNGNPNYLIYTDDGVVRTETDSMTTYKYNFHNLINENVSIEYRLTPKGKAILIDIKE